MEVILAGLIGISLAACCGLRVFLPLLVASIAFHSGHASTSPEFAWIGSWTAISVLSVATILEVTAYSVPWLDNLLDSVAVPAAIVAGTFLSATLLTDLSPVLQWSCAVIAGGGAAGAIGTATGAVRAFSSVTTAGIGNVFVSFLETLSSVILSVLALFFPVLVLALFGLLGFFIFRRVTRA